MLEGRMYKMKNNLDEEQKEYKNKEPTAITNNSTTTSFQTAKGTSIKGSTSVSTKY